MNSRPVALGREVWRRPGGRAGIVALALLVLIALISEWVIIHFMTLQPGAHADNIPLSNYFALRDCQAEALHEFRQLKNIGQAGSEARHWRAAAWSSRL